MVIPIPSFSFLTNLARSTLAVVAGGTLLLAAGAMVRRWHSDRFDLRVKKLCGDYGLTPAGLLQGKYSPQHLAGLRVLPLSTLELLLEPLLLRCSSAPPLVSVLRGLSLELGLIDAWQRRVLGQFPSTTLRQALTMPDGLLYFLPRLRFLLRARSARNLGLLRHQASWPVLARALDDAHPDVQQVALRSLAALCVPESLPVLVAQMDKAVSARRSGLSLHSLKAALATFPPSQALQLLPALRHPDPRVRGAAAEVLREMAKHQTVGFSALLQYRAVLDRELAALASDADPGVRLIAGEVIALLASASPSSGMTPAPEENSTGARAGALQALLERPKLLRLAEIQRFLSDPQPSVRQAAVRAYLAHGPRGISRLYEVFLKTVDKSLRDLIIEELDQAGVLLSLLQNLGDSPSNLETQVVRQFVSMGATHRLKAALTNQSGRRFLEGLLENLEDHCPPRIDAWLGLCAALSAAKRRGPAGHGPSSLAA